MTDARIEKLAEQMHIWYLEACQKLHPESFNEKAQKPYAELSEEQKFLDRYIAERALSWEAAPAQGSAERDDILNRLIEAQRLEFKRIRDAIDAVIPYLPDRNDALNYASTNDGRASEFQCAALRLREIAAERRDPLANAPDCLGCQTNGRQAHICGALNDKSILAPLSVPQASSEPCERQRLAELATDFFLEPDTNKRKDEYVKRLLAYWRFNMSFSDAGQASAPEGEKR